VGWVGLKLLLQNANKTISSKNMTVKDSIMQQNSGEFDIMIEFKNTIQL
jgi:hypothetical protein